MKHFYIYGTDESDFEKLKSEMTHLFGVVLQEHESDWWGIYAKGETPLIEEIKLYQNFVEGEGLHEDEGGYEYLLSISYPENPHEIPALMKACPSRFELVRHNVL